MSSITMTEIKRLEVRDSDNNLIGRGCPIVLRIKDQDIVCRFIAIDKGYFVTETLDGEHENKYRLGSIEHCKRISRVVPCPDDDESKMVNPATE